MYFFITSLNRLYSGIMIDDVQTEERDDIFHDDELIRSLLNENNADDLLIHALLTDDVEEYGYIFF